MSNFRSNNTLVIIPAFNEEKNVGKVITEIKSYYKEIDILVINDGSNDKTSQVLNNYDVIVLNHVFNMGIGASLESACQYALIHNYKYIVRLDADGQHSARFINDLLLPIIKGEADIVIGSRFLGKSEFKSSPFRLIGIRIITFFLKLFSGKKATDPTSGFCSMSKKAFKFFAENCPDDYPEPEILVYNKEFAIKEIPILFKKREGGISSITPLKSIYYMVKVLFSLFIHIFKKELK